MVLERMTMQLCTPHSRHWLTASPFLALLCGRTVTRIEPVGTCRARLCVLLMDVWRCVQGGDSGVHHCDRQQSPQARTLTAQSQSQLAGRPLRLLCSDCRSPHRCSPPCPPSSPDLPQRISPFVSRSLVRCSSSPPPHHRRRVLHGQLSVAAQGAANRHGEAI